MTGRKPENWGGIARGVGVKKKKEHEKEIRKWWTEQHQHGSGRSSFYQGLRGKNLAGGGSPKPQHFIRLDQKGGAYGSGEKISLIFAN